MNNLSIPVAIMALTIACSISPVYAAGFHPDNISCKTDSTLDSVLNRDGMVKTINAYEPSTKPLYQEVVTRFDNNNQFVTMDFMVHEATDEAGHPVTPKGLLVLIAGGQLDAGIVGTLDPDSHQGEVSRTGKNFVVRSAHLYARQGYKVITIDQPSDIGSQFLPEGNTSPSALDSYRTSPQHAVDLSAVINNVDTELPVYLVGTSRGTISAIAQSDLSNGLVLSSPLTVDGNAGAIPIYADYQTDPARVHAPAHVTWHRNDACSKSPPDNAENLAAFFNAGARVKGGFIHPEYTGSSDADTCSAFVYHGFMGIESCTVNTQTNWLDSIVLSGKKRPYVPPHYLIGSLINENRINIGSLIPPGGFASLPFSTTPAGGHVWMEKDDIIYTAPVGMSGNRYDRFVYTITDENGIVGHNNVTVYIFS